MGLIRVRAVLTGPGRDGIPGRAGLGAGGTHATTYLETGRVVCENRSRVGYAPFSYFIDCFASGYDGGIQTTHF